MRSDSRLSRMLHVLLHMTRHDAPFTSEQIATMLGTNPKFILRNHLGELAIRQAREKDFSGVARLLALLENPYAEHPGHEAEAGFPPEWATSIELSWSS